MRIPETLKVGPYTYAVKELEEVKSERGADLWGQCLMEEQEISLRAGQSSDRKAVALFHEVLHALEDVLEITINEKDLTRLAPALYQVLRDNDLLKE